VDSLLHKAVEQSGVATDSDAAKVVVLSGKSASHDPDLFLDPVNEAKAATWAAIYTAYKAAALANIEQLYGRNAISPLAKQIISLY